MLLLIWFAGIPTQDPIETTESPEEMTTQEDPVEETTPGIDQYWILWSVILGLQYIGRYNRVTMILSLPYVICKGCMISRYILKNSHGATDCLD